jgi:class 3 adenylate cyclase
MAVSGLNHSKKQENTTNNIVRAAVEMSYYLKNRKSLINKNWEMRIGINTGEVIGGIVGVKKYMYDIFGKTVNIAARMEQFSIAGKINLSEDSYNLVKDLYEFEKRDLINVKGIGEMQMYFLKYLEN